MQWAWNWWKIMLDSQRGMVKLTYSLIQLKLRVEMLNVECIMVNCLLPVNIILIEIILHSVLFVVDSLPYVHMNYAVYWVIQLSLKRKYFELCQDILQQDGLHIPLQQGPLPQSSRVLQSGPVIGVFGHGSKITKSNYL